MERAEAVAEIRRSAIYRVGVWFTRLLFSSFQSGDRAVQLSTSAATGEAGLSGKDLSERIATAEGRVEARFWESRTYRSAIGSLRVLALFGLIAPIVVMALMVGRAAAAVVLIIWIPLWLGAAIVLGVALRKVATVVRDIRAQGHEEQPWALVIGRLSQDVWRWRDKRDAV